MENEILDYYDPDQNTLFIRRRDILQLAATGHFLQNVWFTLSGNWLTLPEMDQRVATASTMLQQDARVKRLHACWQLLSKSGHLDLIQRFMILLMCSEFDPCADDATVQPQRDLMIILLLPWLIELARCPTEARSLPVLTDCNSFNHWFITTLSEKGLCCVDISFLMSLLLGGFGIVTPTTATVRFIASTKNSVNYALAGALCAAGPAHLGACQHVTELLTTLTDHLHLPTIDAAVRRYCARRPWPGFGHPVMPCDTRVEAFFCHYGDDFHCYKALAERISSQSQMLPNVDYLIGSACAQWQISPQVAVLAFFACRAPILLGHYRLRYHAHPFGMSSSELRARYKELPEHWL